eukprot:TRINITY_DN3673_c0_g1_i1.p1 TRINITY_DN3673_c0_g1~~TRINITY_DN3673_c0_g1_i1.p1  ORF type:complete len:333 (-),score=111.51 TRINITY_DN3673_c0_g1_i1:88-1086(-)
MDPRKNVSEGEYNIRLIVGSANKKLGQEIAAILGSSVEDCDISKFADGEINIHIKNNIRGSDVFILQPTCPPDVNGHIMELLLLIHTLKLASAKRISVIMPYYGYARQDRKVKPRTPISASAIAQLIEAMGPHRVVTVDLHCGQIQGFFHDTPVDNLFSDNVFISYIQQKNIPPNDLVIVSPDAGGVAKARRIADRIGAFSVVTILKRRVAANKVDSMQIVGEVNGKIAIIIDDMIDTGGTLCKAAQVLKDAGALQVVACATHGLFSADALDRINNSVLEEVCVTDTIPQDKNSDKCKKLVVRSVVPLLAEAIRRLHEEKSLSLLFENNSTN